jgi:pyruvate dehydrogenase E2 component (dihydrolipoamide acetyltransferase)
MADVRAYIQQLQQLASAPQTAPAKPVAEHVDFAQWGPVVHKPLSALRQTIARRMHESWTAVPRLTLTGFALKAVAATLRKHPSFNASLDEAAGEIVLKEYLHIGVAVDTEHGLIVPVIRDVSKKSLLELSKELEAIAVKVRRQSVNRASAAAPESEPSANTAADPAGERGCFMLGSPGSLAGCGKIRN